MGWKTDTILIRPAGLDGGPEKLLAELGYRSPRKVSETSFGEAGAGSIWIGAIGDCVILYTDLAGGFFSDEVPEANEFKTAVLQRLPTLTSRRYPCRAWWGLGVSRCIIVKR
jgi:hypothetical protein